MGIFEFKLKPNGWKTTSLAVWRTVPEPHPTRGKERGLHRSVFLGVGRLRLTWTWGRSEGALSSAEAVQLQRGHPRNHLRRKAHCFHN